jgi:hypothetical protein
MVRALRFNDSINLLVSLKTGETKDRVRRDKRQGQERDGLDMVAHTVIQALRSLKQENHEFKDSLGYIGRPCLTRPKMIII